MKSTLTLNVQLKPSKSGCRLASATTSACSEGADRKRRLIEQARQVAWVSDELLLVLLGKLGLGLTLEVLLGQEEANKVRLEVIAAQLDGYPAASLR